MKSLKLIAVFVVGILTGSLVTYHVVDSRWTSRASKAHDNTVIAVTKIERNAFIDTVEDVLEKQNVQNAEIALTCLRDALELYKQSVNTLPNKILEDTDASAPDPQD